MKEAGEVTVTGLKLTRERGGVGIGRAERDTLGEGVTALRRAVTATVAAFQAELTDVVALRNKENNDNNNSINNDGGNNNSSGGGGGGNGGGGGGGNGGSNGGDASAGAGLREVAIRLSATGARLQKDVKAFEALVRRELDKQAGATVFYSCSAQLETSPLVPFSAQLGPCST